MAFDYKKEYKEFYLPKSTPAIVDVTSMNYIAVNGNGDPNESNGEYKSALRLLYAVAYTLKMSYKGNYKMAGFFQYVVPPLEGLWWTLNSEDIIFKEKSDFCWIAMIRVPEFVKQEDVEWAKREVEVKKGLDTSMLNFINLEEGLCVQIMHIGPYETEAESLRIIDEFLKSKGYIKDINSKRRHHEIYLSDPRKTIPEKLKTVIRIPISEKL